MRCCSEHRRIVAGVPNTLPPQGFTGMLSLAASDVFAGRAGARTIPGRPGTKLAFITCGQGLVKPGRRCRSQVFQKCSTHIGTQNSYLEPESLIHTNLASNSTQFQLDRDINEVATGVLLSERQTWTKSNRSGRRTSMLESGIVSSSSVCGFVWDRVVDAKSTT